MPAKRLTTVCLVALLVSVSASLCCMPLWMQADANHSCCKHSIPSPITACDSRLDVARAEHMSFEMGPTMLTSDVVAVAMHFAEVLAADVSIADYAAASSPANVLRI